MNFFSFNFPLRKYFFVLRPPHLPHKFSNGPSLKYAILFYFIYFLLIIYLLNIILYTGRQIKRRRNSKKINKQTSKKKCETRKFNRLTTTSRTSGKNNNIALLLNYYKSTLIRNAQGGPLISVFVKIFFVFVKNAFYAVLCLGCSHYKGSMSVVVDPA